MARMALEAGGHLRVGHEDWAGPRQRPDGSPVPTNAELVRAAVELCAQVGRPVATASEAGELLGIGNRSAASGR